jgi:hypothetical protein
MIFMTSIKERPCYQARSIVDWPRLPVLVVVSLAAALGLGWLLQFAFMHGFYFIFLSPILAAVGLSAAMRPPLVWAKCRSGWLAFVVAAVAGTILYLSYYQFCLAAMLPRQGWRFDLLPRYIRLRIQTDVARKAGQAAPVRPSPILNTIKFCFDLAIIAGIAGVVARKRARYAFCDELDDWMTREQTLLPRNAGFKLRDALESGRLAEFVASWPQGTSPQQSAQLIVEYAGTGSPLEYPIYASIEDFTGQSRFRQTVVRQIELEPKELLDLCPLLPGLARVLEALHPEIGSIPRPALATRTPNMSAGEVSEISPVPEPFRQRVRSRGYALSVNIRGVMPLVYILGGLGIMVAAAQLRGQGPLLAILAVGVGAVSFLWGIYTALYCTGVGANRWVERRLRRELSERSDAWVDASDPDSVYVSIIPREHFSKVKLTMASDLLLLKLDKQKKQIVMEGDSNRYRIPAGAILLCEPQCFFAPGDTHQRIQIWMLRLIVNTGLEQKEILFNVDHTTWRPVTNRRRQKQAEGMCARIRELSQDQPKPGLEPSRALG